VRAFLAYPLAPVPRDPAREEAARELSKDIYRRNEPSAFEQLVDWLQRQLTELFSRTAGSTPGGTIGLLIIVTVVLALIVAVLIRFGPLARSRRSAQVAHLEPTETEAEHRRLADAFAADGKYDEAVRERLRAIVRSLTERGVLDNRLGRTATEIAVEAGSELPTVAADLLAATDTFGAIWYGRLPATAEHDALLRTVDEKVAAARPGQPGDLLVGAALGWAMPSASAPPTTPNQPTTPAPASGQETR
jgi:hypothetical protein